MIAKRVLAALTKLFFVYSWLEYAFGALVGIGLPIVVFGALSIVDRAAPTTPAAAGMKAFLAPEHRAGIAALIAVAVAQTLLSATIWRKLGALTRRAYEGRFWDGDAAVLLKWLGLLFSASFLVEASSQSVLATLYDWGDAALAAARQIDPQYNPVDAATLLKTSIQGSWSRFIFPEFSGALKLVFALLCAAGYYATKQGEEIAAEHSLTV